MTVVRPDLQRAAGDATEASLKIRRAFEESAANYAQLASHAHSIAQIAAEIVARVKRGGCVMFCGNGGSAADAQHLAAELQGRYLKERAPLASVALSANSSTLTAIGNDYSFDEIFERQVRGLGKANDVLIGISTSGNSKNVMRALAAAKSIGAYAVALTGETGGQMPSCCDAIIRVPSRSTPRIQEMHIGVGHMICQIIEDCLF